MGQRKDISEELRILSKVVDGISRNAPYQAPEGYFEGFSAGLIARIRSLEPLRSPEPVDRSDLRSDLGSAAGSDPSSKAGSPGIEAENTAPFAPLWEQISRDPVFKAPDGYFDNFAEILLNRIKAGPATETGQTPENNSREELASLSPLLSGIAKKTTFQAPEGYFSELAAGIVSGVKAIEFVNDELEEPASLLAGLKDKQTYQAPEGYFDLLAVTILKKAKLTGAGQEQDASKPPANRPSSVVLGSAQTISIKRNKSKSWIRYAAAAAVTGLILVAGWPILHKTGGTVTPDIQKSLAKVSDQEILNYIDNQTITNPQAETMTNGSTATLDINESDIKTMMGDVPDDELKQYLEEHGG